ncbi:HRDC domain-containing protein [Ancylomarina sp. YFZ004]
MSEKQTIPTYAVFTDAELAEITKLEYANVSDLLKIGGVGKNKVEKFGELILK